MREKPCGNGGGCGRRSGLLMLGFVVLLAGCQGALASGVTAFHEARYPDAASEFAQAAPTTLNGSELARYELYVGPNHLALGNQRLAVAHLERARLLLESQPDLFTLDEQARLFRAWRSLGRLPGQALAR